MRPVLLLLLGSLAAFAQPFTVGIKAGVPLTDFLNATETGTFSYTAPATRYIVGATAELKLPASLAIEFDALYRRVHYNGTGNGVDVFTSSQTTGNAWEFPLLLKYRFHAPVVRPYVDAGAAFDTLTGLNQTVTQTLIPSGSASTSTTGNPPELKNTTTAGFVLGAGVDIHAIFLHISPEVRYTRWTSAQISAANGLLRSNQNQAEFLVGFTF
jgi:outer membrane protein W